MSRRQNQPWTRLVLDLQSHSITLGPCVWSVSSTEERRPRRTSCCRPDRLRGAEPCVQTTCVHMSCDAVLIWMRALARSDMFPQKRPLLSAEFESSPSARRFSRTTTCCVTSPTRSDQTTLWFLNQSSFSSEPRFAQTSSILFQIPELFWSFPPLLGRFLFAELWISERFGTLGKLRPGLSTDQDEDVPLMILCRNHELVVCLWAPGPGHPSNSS